MQPYFFPYIGYLSLIKQTDKFILFDPVQFIRHGWIERNRILKPNEGVQYIKVPLNKHSRGTLIRDITISENVDWKEKMIRQLEHYKKHSPYYDDTIEMIKNAISIETNSIVELNKHILEAVCEYLGINSDFEIFSRMNLDIEEPDTPDEWALNICKSLGEYSEYWNPEGGLSFFDRRKYEDAGIDIKFLKMNDVKYSQKRDVFEPNLSIIDIMLFLAPEEINGILDEFTIL